MAPPAQTAHRRARRTLEQILEPACGVSAAVAADRLLSRIGSFGDVLAADPALLAEELDAPAIRQLQLVRAAAIEMQRSSLAGRCVVTNLGELLDYLKLRLQPLREEEVRALYLNAGHEIVHDECIGGGTIDEATIFPRQIVARCLQVGAKGVMLTHNHPSGNPTPSDADVETTRRIESALATMDIHLHDHLIIARRGYFSMRAAGLL